MAELRKDLVTGRWVIISTARGKRPTDFPPDIKETKGKENCPFCPGNEALTPPEIYALRPNGSPQDRPGWKVRVVPNKYPALGIDFPLSKKGLGIYDQMSGFGAHEVIIETTDHEKTIEDLSTEEIRDVVTVCQDRIQDLHKDVRFRYVLLFKNEGVQAGASLSHPHSQLIATPITPKRVKEKLVGAQAYFRQKERCVYCDIIAHEKEGGIRLVYENEHFLTFCPFASRFPFEMCLLPKHHEINFHESRDHLTALAQCLKATMEKLDSVLNHPQYNYVFHSAPNLFPRPGRWQTIHEDYHWHLEIIPRLTKVAGFEWGTGFYINPTSPEDAAKYLREAEVSV
jgi:UDPglucose--hexose-1-phosphate uridylyltransferase